MTDTEDEVELKPAEENPWYVFMEKTLELDEAGKKDRGWHWFWGLYYLRHELSKFPKFDIKEIQDKLPNNHWLKKERGLPPDYSTDFKTLVSNFKESYSNPDGVTKIAFVSRDFTASINLSNFIFPIVTQINKSVFSDSSNFNNAIFFKNVYFNDTKFCENANFENTAFYGDVTVFMDVNFEKVANFTNAKLQSYTYFKIAKFLDNANFKNASFLKNADFTDAVFSETANFEKATFSGETAKFRDATFTKIVNFKETTFEGYANFKTSTFDGRTIFQKATFKLHAPRFYGAKFNNEMILNGIKLPEPTRYKKDDEEESNDDYQKRVEENQSAYETLVFLMETLNKYHDRHFFFREEMRWRQVENTLKQQELKNDSVRRKNEWYLLSYRRIKNKWKRFENRLTIIFFWLYENLSDYGYGIGRAFIWWLGNICFWTGMLFFFGYEHIQFTFERLMRSFLASLSNAHSFFLSKSEGLSGCCNKNESTLIFDMIWAVETILGVLFLFLFLLTLRIRFRLK